MDLKLNPFEKVIVLLVVLYFLWSLLLSPDTPKSNALGPINFQITAEQKLQFQSLGIWPIDLILSFLGDLHLTASWTA